MRVVSGKARGTQLQSVPGDTTRPILDRVKTALFDTIRSRLEGTKWLDLFAGTGSVGIEALSQGAAHATFLDIAPKAIETIKKNLEKTRLTDQSEVRHTDAFTYLKNTSKNFDFIYIAPPQYKGIWIETLKVIAERTDLLTSCGELIVQIDPSEYEEFLSPTLTLTERRKYGATELLFLKKS